MNTIILSIAVVAALVFQPVVFAGEVQGDGFRHGQKEKVKEYRSQQKAENTAFCATLEGMSPEEKKAALKAHHEGRYQENLAFRQKVYEENTARLKEKLASNPQLTEEQKQEILNSFKERYQKNLAYRQKQHDENIAFFEKIANDSNLTPQQKKEAMQTHRQAQKAENREYCEGRHAERKAFKEKIHSELKANQGT